MDGSKLHQSGFCVVATLSRVAVVIAANVAADDFAEIPSGDAQLRIV
jgi:DeoR/GlpR family transcriptional regulator of sugar metabolism